MEDKIISIDTPTKVNIKIKQTGPSAKGASVTQKYVFKKQTKERMKKKTKLTKSNETKKE